MDVWKSFKRLSIIHVNGKDMELLDMMLPPKHIANVLPINTKGERTINQRVSREVVNGMDRARRCPDLLTPLGPATPGLARADSGPLLCEVSEMRRDINGERMLQHPVITQSQADTHRDHEIICTSFR